MPSNLEELIQSLTRDGVLKTTSLIQAFKKVDRKDFVPKEYASEAYGDYPLPIAAEQTISQPYTVAFMLELLEPQEGEKVLDVGSGSGWTTTLLAEIVGSEGQVWGLERHEELVEFGQENLAKYKFQNAEIQKTGETLGLKEKAPFDKILVSAGSKEIPDELLVQLKLGGVMVVPVSEGMLKIEKISETETKTQRFEGFSFVPLIY